MPDIRNFFGGRGAPPPKPSVESSKTNGDTAAKRTRGNRKVVDDSDEEFESSKKPTPKKASPPSRKKPKKEPSPEGEITSTNDYFGSSKPKRSTPSKPKPAAPTKQSPPNAKTATPNRVVVERLKSASNTPAKPATNGRTSSRSKKQTNYAEDVDDVDDDGYPKVVDDDFEDAEDIFAAAAKTGKRMEDDYESSEEEEIKPKVRSKRSAEPISKPRSLNDSVPVRKSSNATTPRTQKSKDYMEISDDEDDDDDIVLTAAKKPKTPAKKRTPKKQEPKTESKEIQAILDSIPTVRPPTPPPASGEPVKFNFRAGAKNLAAPAAQGSKEMPIGEENCLTGLTFVFTGILQTLARDEGQNLVKKYGGKITGAPSKKTDYVVLGSDAGPKKLQTISQNKIKTIDEDGLFELIRRMPANGGDGKAAEANEEKKRKEQEKIEEAAAEMEKQERAKEAAAKKARAVNQASGPVPAEKSINGTTRPQSGGQLWTTKYAPTQTSQICGNKSAVEKLQRWLREWQKSASFNFKKPGKDGSGLFRAAILYGGPGIGKTTAAHLVANLEGYDVLESNASDTRSKKLVDTGLKGVLDNTSLLGYFAGDEKSVDAKKKKIVLIMDEVDGMSAGDRGGVGALAAMCKKTHIPMILICNDRKSPKMRPFDHVTTDIQFRKPTTQDIRSRIMTICYREGMRLPPQVIDALIEGANADIRQIVNMISQIKLDSKAMDFDSSKNMVKAWEKHIVLKPWDITQKLLGGGWFAQSSNKTLNDKIELYFNDHEFTPLMIQENYLKTTPAPLGQFHGKERILKALELADKAAESISDGDLVDRMIHGSQQQWSLMPTHAVFSTVRPSSFIAGSLAGYGPDGTAFTKWLGMNSKQGKLTRFVKEIQAHMRLRTSGDRHEIRQQYLPILWSKLINRLQVDGKEAVEDVIELMDSYFLTKDDWDAILELGVGEMDMERVKIETQAKSTFTRIYNTTSHPLPFMKASSTIAPKKSARDKPDLEEAIDESDDADDVTADRDANDELEEELDLSKDKYVKQPKKKKASAAPKKVAAASTKKPAKRKAGKAESEDEDLSGFVVSDESKEEVQTKKRKTTTKEAPAGKGKGKK